MRNNLRIDHRVLRTILIRFTSYPIVCTRASIVGGRLSTRCYRLWFIISFRIPTRSFETAKTYWTVKIYTNNTKKYHNNTDKPRATDFVPERMINGVYERENERKRGLEQTLRRIVLFLFI